MFGRFTFWEKIVMSKGEKKNNTVKPATAGGFGLNFSNAPVSASAIEDALKEQQEKQEKERALARQRC